MVEAETPLISAISSMVTASESRSSIRVTEFCWTSRIVASRLHRRRGSIVLSTVTALAVATRSGDGHKGPAPERPSPWRAIATALGLAAIAAELIGVLLALTIDTPIGSLLTSPGLLIPTAIAVFAPPSRPGNER